MRLTCPNCGAQYDVPTEVIPQGGRDVQCSNCGVTWFQHHPDHPPPPDEDETGADWDTPEADTDWDAPEAGDIEDAELVEDNTADDSTVTADPEPQAAVTASSERRSLDSSIAEVLRAEAERERAARAAAAAAAGGLETQPELGLNEGAPKRPQEPLTEVEKRSSEAKARMDRLRGAPQQGDAPPDHPDPGTRRNLLPDIDEINSSLDSDPRDPRMIEPASSGADAGATGGFRRGFLSVLVLAVIGLLLYIFAPQLAQAVPALDGVMSGYVALIDMGRAWLDGMVGSLTG